MQILLDAWGDVCHLVWRYATGDRPRELRALTGPKKILQLPSSPNKLILPPWNTAAFFPDNGGLKIRWRQPISTQQSIEDQVGSTPFLKSCNTTDCCTSVKSHQIGTLNSKVIIILIIQLCNYRVEQSTASTACFFFLDSVFPERNQRSGDRLKAGWIYHLQLHSDDSWWIFFRHSHSEDRHYKTLFFPLAFVMRSPAL